MAFYHTNFMLQTPHEDDDHHNQPPIFPSCNPHEFHASILGKRPSMSFSLLEHHPNNNNRVGDDEYLSDDGSQLGDKKKRLTAEQVKTLEKNFELGNKLEPDRKLELARALGLRPRQIAIWFQNRRARWKTKQLEKNYDLLRKQFEAARSENDALHAQNQKLQAEILAMKTKEPTESINLNKETDQGSICSNRSENSSQINLDISRKTAIDTPILPKIANRSLDFQPSLSRPGIEGPKMDHTVKEESLCNIFSGMDDQIGFWPWLEQQNFN